MVIQGLSHAKTIAAPPPDTPYSCGYEVHEEEKGWLEAEQDCISRGGHLASAHSELDLAVLSKAISAHDSVWIGLNEREVRSHFIIRCLLVVPPQLRAYGLMSTASVAVGDGLRWQLLRA
jgi:hypothetical protein